MAEKLKCIGKQFDIDGIIQSITSIDSGHINDTFLVTTLTGKKYILQKINAFVFNDAKSLINNKVLVSEHLQKSRTPYKVLTFIKTLQGHYYLTDEDQNLWNMMTFIPDSITHDKATNSKIVNYSGKLYGDFIIQTSTFEANLLTEIIPDFHSIPLRYRQFEDALKKAKNETKLNAEDEINFILSCKDEMHELSRLKDKNTFPIRVTHNDAKLSNILFNTKDEGLAVIDLDTVMPGIVHFDFGDSIRSICSTATEDETNLSLVTLNIDYFKAFCTGFAESTKHLLTPIEIKYLPLGAKTITFIMGLRMLTDYLNNNIYYKIDYELHNLDRAKNQFKLVKSIQQNYNTLQAITLEAFAK